MSQIINISKKKKKKTTERKPNKKTVVSLFRLQCKNVQTRSAQGRKRSRRSVSHDL